MVLLYMDESARGTIVAGLRARGVDLVTTQEDGRMGASDPEVLDRATELERALFSQDEDLVAEGVRRQRAGISFPGVIFAHPGRVRVGVCVEQLELIAIAGEPEDVQNHVLHLPL